MEPTCTIIEYLWGARNTWLKHHDNCDCPPEKLIEEFLDQSVSVNVWLDIVTSLDGVVECHQIQMLPREWNETVGPKAHMLYLTNEIEKLTGRAAELMAVAATYERMNNG